MTEELKFVDVLVQGNVRQLSDNAYIKAEVLNRNRDQMLRAGMDNLQPAVEIEQVPVTEGLTFTVKKDIRRAR